MTLLFLKIIIFLFYWGDFLIEIIKTALRSLKSNRVRSFLTMLGIVIGVASVITMVSIGNGATQQVEKFVSGFGANLIIVMPTPPNNTGARGAAGSGESLTLDDSEAIIEGSFYILRVAPEVNGVAQIIYGNNNWNTSITGGTPDIIPVRTWEIQKGVCFSESDVRAGSKKVFRKP